MHARGLKPEEHKSFGQEVQEWIKSRVARHKFLRGGTCLPPPIALRADVSAVSRCGYCGLDTQEVSTIVHIYARIHLTDASDFLSAAGKILRRELRERAKAEVEAESKLKAKL